MMDKPNFQRDRTMSSLSLLCARSKLDQAIITSVAAMLAMNLFVLAGQFQPAHAIAMVQAAGALMA
jgi:hypothetical protein